MKFLSVFPNYHVADGAFVPEESGAPVRIPDRRVALLRPLEIGGVSLVVVETVNGRSYYMPSSVDDVEARLL